MTQSQSQNQQSQSQRQDRASQPAGGGGAQPSAVSSETREQLGDTQQQQADYGTPRGPAAAETSGESGENLTPSGADAGNLVNGLREDRDGETPQPEQQQDPRRQGNFASDSEDDDDDSAIGMNGE